MHGLTRNSADFAELCEALNDDFRLIAADQRGRGRSQYDANPVRYHPGTYVQDMFTLLAHLGLRQVIAIGTSMGGLMAMMMAALRPGCLRAAVLNDVGPEVDPRGLARIKSYVGKTKAPASWSEAADLSSQINGVAFPDYTEADWMAFAHRTFSEDADGRPYPAYDPAIAQPINAAQEAAVPPDLWPAFAALHSVPTLVVRGARSDILSPDCVQAMRARKPDLQVIEVPDRGHAPMLNEPVALKAIRSFLGAVN